MRNPLREKLAAGKRLFGTHVHLTDPRVCEMLGYMGFDYLWIDMEHASMDFQTLEAHLIAAQSGGTPAVVRVMWNDVPFVKRVLEMGPAGVVFPMINSVEEARKALDMCLYPPEGSRGYGPSRAIRYGLDDVAEFIRNAADQTLRILQVETVQAVGIMEEVARLPYLDAFLVGPMDLSGSLGKLGRLQDPEVDGYIDLAVEKAKKLGIPVGTSIGSGREEDLRRWMAKGFDFLSAGIDMASVLHGARDVLACLRSLDESGRK
ncbi:MAG TPA: aldolase/citrate lyase family protein [Clostridia bacterium]|nr:aldolase/citrate lyase family protein [Clostridia bacterium]